MRLAAAVSIAASLMGGCTANRGAEPTRSSAVSAPASAGGRIDVGGYELSYECRGEGSPTILTEAGYDSAGTSAWFDLMGPLAEIGRVCAYDRAGTGTSDARPDASGLTSGDQAAELHALLEEAGIDAPYVLVAHSYGGFVARLFAHAYADETVGLILIESSHEEEIQAYRDLYGAGDPRADWIDGGDLLDIDATAAALQDARDYGSMPLVVIRAEIYEDVLSPKLWRETQADLATLSTDALHVIARGSGHDVLRGNPAVVLAAVSAVVDAMRSDGQLPACADFVADLEADCP